jgi:glycerol-3-phosphate acyltransferase PlsY
MYTVFPFVIVAAYLLGSIPFGLLIARAHGKDLRSIGSGNIGATNVARALGRKWAYVCFFLDVLKGAAPMLGASIIVSQFSILDEHRTSSIEHHVMLWLWLAVGCAAILGHIFPIYLKFKGGKGVSTSFGVALGLWPYFTICGLFAITIWIVVVLIGRYVSLASITASIAFPLVLIVSILLVPSWEFAGLWPLLIVACAIPLMVIVRHRENIKRLIAGTESKITSSKKS